LDPKRRLDLAEAVAEYDRLNAVYPSLGSDIHEVSVAERARLGSSLAGPDCSCEDQGIRRLTSGVGIFSCMTIELALLAASVVLGIVHIIIASHLTSWQRGYRWTASSREQNVAPLTGLAGRVDRALRNYLETFPFFAAAILVVTVTNTHSWLTVWGAQFYFWGRIVYAILYTADLSLARSLVWNIPTIGILMNVAGLLLR